jgi:hypothetical protein
MANDFQLGGHEVKQGTGGEAVNHLDQSKTMFITKLTGEDALRPEVVTGLKNIADVFNHFRPSAEVEFKAEDGSPVSNNIFFTSVGDFGKKGLIAKSDFLQNLETQKEEYLKFQKMLKIKQMSAIIADAQAKESYINALKAMVKELENTGA